MNLSRLYLAFVIILILTSCDSNNHRDLKDIISKYNNPAVTKTNNLITNFDLPSASKYQETMVRSPFEEPNTKQTTIKNLTNPLNLYQLNLLHFVGTMSSNGKSIAYIMTPDNKVYEVKLGDTIGDHNGRIIKITHTRLEIVEQLDEPGQSGAARIITLQLKDEN